jgi:hypothetical protein
MHEKFECNRYIMDKIETEGIHGVTYGHVVSNAEKGVSSWIIEYRISSAFDEIENWKETRACREVSRRASKDVPKINKSALRDELVILPGAAMSAADVVRALRRCIKDLEETGMFTGRYNGEYIIEKVDGRLELA